MVARPLLTPLEPEVLGSAALDRGHSYRHSYDPGTCPCAVHALRHVSSPQQRIFQQASRCTSHVRPSLLVGRLGALRCCMAVVLPLDEPQSAGCHFKHRAGNSCTKH